VLKDGQNHVVGRMQGKSTPTRSTVAQLNSTEIPRQKVGDTWPKGSDEVRDAFKLIAISSCKKCETE